MTQIPAILESRSTLGLYIFLPPSHPHHPCHPHTTTLVAPTTPTKPDFWPSPEKIPPPPPTPFSPSGPRPPQWRRCFGLWPPRAAAPRRLGGVVGDIGGVGVLGVTGFPKAHVAACWVYRFWRSEKGNGFGSSCLYGFGSGKLDPKTCVEAKNGRPTRGPDGTLPPLARYGIGDPSRPTCNPPKSMSRGRDSIDPTCPPQLPKSRQFEDGRATLRAVSSMAARRYHPRGRDWIGPIPDMLAKTDCCLQAPVSNANHRVKIRLAQADSNLFLVRPSALGFERSLPPVKQGSRQMKLGHSLGVLVLLPWFKWNLTRESLNPRRRCRSQNMSNCGFPFRFCS